MLAAPLVDRIQRLSRPIDGDASLPASFAAETALFAAPRLSGGTLTRIPGPSAGRSLPRLPARAASPAPPPETGPAPAADHPDYGAPTWLTIPAIGVDSPIEAVGIRDGFYQTVPFKVGFHEDAAPPGALGNSIYNGHVTSLTDGRVFASLTDLKENETVAIYTDTHRTEWAVAAAGWAAADEDWYIQPTQDVRVTLYTCGGDFDVVRRDYSHRYVVIAALVRAVPLQGGDQ